MVCCSGIKLYMKCVALVYTVLIKAISFDLTNVVQHTTGSDQLRIIHNINIQSLKQTMPSTFQSTIGMFNNNSCLAKPIVIELLLGCETTIVHGSRGYAGSPNKTSGTLLPPRTTDLLGRRLFCCPLQYRLEFMNTRASCTRPGQPTYTSVNRPLWSTVPCRITEWNPFRL